jgi:hypothetical protein
MARLGRNTAAMIDIITHTTEEAILVVLTMGRIHRAEVTITVRVVET